MNFPTDYNDIIHRLENINPVKYAATRNYINGDVTYLSPYISRGVISLPQVARQALKNNRPEKISKFLQELGWREYWQRCWQHLGENIFSDIKQPQQDVLFEQLAAALQKATTSIEAIDEHIKQWYQTGYLHNHLRMYIASIACNIGHAQWLNASKWMYYHLLDGDLASNSLSWQWVAGTFSSKKYYCNQENINRYTGSNQQNSFLDKPYELLTTMPVPERLQAQAVFNLCTTLPETPAPKIVPGLPVLIYNAYNLDPVWHADDKCNRILLLEPSHYSRHPVSEKVLQFILALSNNIPEIQIFTGEFSQLQQLTHDNELIFKTHPAYRHYTGTAENSDWLFPAVTGSFNSFFAYWKKCERYLHEL